MRFLLPIAAQFRRRASLVIVGLALALALPAAASAAPFTAHLKAPNHTPTANKRWPITVTASHGRTKPGGVVRYEFLFAGQVVAHRPGHGFRGGVFHDRLLFPSAAIGHPITLRVIVKTRFGTVNLNWKVTTRA
jgi:hypothetical protein